MLCVLCVYTQHIYIHTWEYKKPQIISHVCSDWLFSLFPTISDLIQDLCVKTDFAVSFLGVHTILIGPSESKERKTFFHNSETLQIKGLFFYQHLVLLSWQYYYSVRIFPGQEPANVWVGWITSDFHQYDTGFDLDRVRTVTVTLGDEKGKVHERLVFLNFLHEWHLTKMLINLGNFFLNFIPTINVSIYRKNIIKPIMSVSFL